MSATDHRPLPPEGESMPSHIGQDERLQALVDDYLRRLRDGDSPDPYELMLLHLPIAQEVEERLEMAALLHRFATCGAEAETSRGNMSVLEVRVSGPVAHAAARADLPPGTPTLIGRYEVRKQLGSGATGVVYEAFDPLLRRSVALKVLRQDRPADGGHAHVLDRDARIAAGLRHPNIVPVHETADDGGLRYVVMGLIEGETLEARLQRGAPTADEAVELARQLAWALAYAHESGVVHRDVKPANILLCRREGRPDEPHLTDFGLARLADRDTSISQGVLVIGTWAYMPPEQAQGHGSKADGRSDVYSLGVVLYRMLTGRLPFEADTPTGWLAQIESAPPPALRTINPSVPRDLEAICLKTLAKEPGRRFATARDFADELGRWLRREPLTTRPPRLWELLWLWASRNRETAWVVVVAAALLGVVSAVLGGTAWKAKEDGWKAQENTWKAEKEAADAREAHARTIEEQLKREVFEADTRAHVEIGAVLDLARLRLQQPTEGRRDAVQAALRRTDAPRKKIREGETAERLDLRVRSLFAAALGVPEVRVVEKASLPASVFATWPTAIHPDGKSMVLGFGQPPRALRWKFGEPLKLPKDPEDFGTIRDRHRVTYSPDGKFVALMPSAGGLQVWDGDVTRNTDLEPGGKVPYLAAGFGAAGKALCACRTDGEVRCWSLPDLKPLPPWKDDGKPGTGLSAAAFNADATLLVVAEAAGASRLRGPEGKSQLLAPARAPVTVLALSPDSRFVAVGDGEGTLQLIQRGDGEPVSLRRLPLGNSEVTSITFHPEGRYVLAGCRGTRARMWDIETGDQVLTLPCIPLGFARDGRRFAGGSTGDVVLGELSLPEVVRPLTGHATQVDYTFWSRDNRHMGSFDPRFVLRVWDVATGRLLNEITAPRGDFFASNASAALSDDGAQLAYASGGRKDRVVIWDVKSGKKLEEWPLPRPGFDRLACAGGAKFLLVREEPVEGGKGSLRTAAYEFATGKAPREVREVRPAEEGDVMFMSSRLTPDGRYYVWNGPRAPRKAYRVEVREVATGRLVTRVPYRPGKDVGEFEATLSSDGRFLWVPRDEGDGSDRHDLSATTPPQKVATVPLMSPGQRWTASVVGGDESRATQALALRRGDSDATWLELENRDASGPCGPSFSPDGRYLVWGSMDGALSVADLNALEEQVSAFAKDLRPK